MRHPTVDEIIQDALAKAALVAAAHDGFTPCRVCKVDEDRQLVFGWASVCTQDGQAVIDKQGDIIPPDELENAAYEFNLYCRKQGDMHDRLGVGRLVESMVFTAEKQAALGIDLGMEGWWVGFKVDDPAVWKRIKAGDLPEFSIGGKATRENVDKAFDPAQARDDHGRQPGAPEQTWMLTVIGGDDRMTTLD